MRVMYISRLFTGLELSLLKKKWVPSGVPTIYKVIEELDNNTFLKIVFTCKEKTESTFTSWEEKKDVLIKLQGIKHPILVLSSRSQYVIKFGRFKNHFRELWQAFRLIKEVSTFKPDLLYFDHSNIWSAGILARTCKIPVVLRIMGIYPVMFQALEKKSFVDCLLCWLYRSPFKLVICTQDGTNVSKWLKEALNPGTLRKVFLNGVNRTERFSDVDQRLSSLPEDRMIILYIGKLETYKGCNDFVDAIINLYPKFQNQIHTVIIGIGNQREALIKKVSQAGVSNDFTFIDRISHHQIMEAHFRADIFVSLNWYGNLSNVNLEAMVAGDCMVVLEPDKKLGYDNMTDILLPSEMVWQVSRTHIKDDLIKAIEYLYHHPEERIRRGTAIAKKAQELIPTWTKRVEDELMLLNELVRD